MQTNLEKKLNSKLKNYKTKQLKTNYKLQTVHYQQ